MFIHHLFHKIAEDRCESQWLNALFYLVSKGYGLGLKLHQMTYRKGWLAVKEAPCKVISVGNLVVGGTGKTPFVAFLADALKEEGKRVAVVVRGYKAKGKEMLISDGKDIFLSPNEAGDEGLLLAQRLKGIPVLQGKSRYQAIQLAVKRFNTELVILDDAFQHYALKKDVEIVLLDARRPFGNFCLLPRGILREPISALNRADAVVLTKIEDQTGAYGLQRWLTVQFPHLSVFMSQSHISFVPELQGQDVVAFCGIARPEDFYQTCFKQGLKIKDFLAFPDHYAYTQRDIKRIKQLAQKMEVKWLVTTEKDIVKLHPFKREFDQAGLRLINSKFEITPVPKEAFRKWLIKKCRF